MLDWIFEGIVTWISSVVSDMMDAVSGLFLQALGTDMTAMEEYFPFVSKAFTVMQYTAWALLFLITVWQLFRVFGGPVTEAENPWVLLGRSALFAFLIGYAKPIFLLTLKIATAPYTALMDIQMTAEDFTFAGIEQALQNGLTSLIATISVVGLLLLTILEIALGWNYFKLLLETVERYIVVGVLCYTSPLAFSMGASKATTPVFRSWCRMVGSQLLLLVMNVWFLRGFSTSVGQYIGTGGALSNGNGNVFLWLFCAVAFLKTAQKFDSYLAAMGLNVAQTGSGMGMELLMAARVITGVAGGARSAGSVFRGGSAATGTGAAASGFAAGFANRFKGNSYVRDAVVDGGTRMGAGGTIGFVGRAFGGMAARNGATLTGESISSVASRTPNVSGSIGGDIANRSLGNYMPHMKGMNLSDTQITGGHISTKAIGADGKETAVEMFNASQFEKPDGPHAVVNASDGSQWYQMASGSGAGAFYDAPVFSGNSAEAAQVAAAFPNADGATLRTVGDGVIEASSDGGVSRWYNSAYYDEPDAPHSTIQAANGVEWYAMQQHAETPPFEAGDAADGYNRAQFQSFMPGYEQPVTSVDGSGRMDGHFEGRHENGSGTMFYDGHVIADAIFGLFRNDENEYTAENAYLTAESAQDGTFKFEKVPFGTWVVREIQSAKGFVLNEKAYPVTVSEDGDVVNIELENRYIRGNIEGTKLDEDGNVIAGAVFGLFREGETEFTEETAVRVTESDSTGKFRFEDIRYGKWIIRELKSATGYVLNKTPIEVEITEDGKTVFITVENKFICGDIKGYKVDEDGKSVVGALFGLFTEDDTEFTEENAVLTAVSDADGIFIFKNVRFGKWIVRELKPAEGFVLNETEFPVDITTDGAVIELKAENRHIYGAVHTTKVDKDYPDHLLTGAVFEVYRDVNENQQFDPDVDELVGTLSECEPGLYELAELRYGGYFLYEKQAPVNFVKDNGYYYFEIVTDGEMVKVENQAGIGFINAHMVGSLKIVKASSDGRVEGFSFRITGENYDEVFTTDANGEIFVENLRIGKYTVTEVEDSVSAGYKRPDPFEIELASDETLTVNVHNDKVTTDHPDSPKTGDNSHMALWLGLMLASLGVLIGTILYSRKKKHLAD